MHLDELKQSLNKLSEPNTQFTPQQRAAVISVLLDTVRKQFGLLKYELCEDDAATQRRKAKRRETELDPKPPVKPVRVAAPSKPKKPKYSGNHAPSTPR